MMRRYFALGAVVLVAVGAAVAQAGPPTTDEQGNFLMIDAQVSPPRAGSGATIHYHAFFGNRRGELLPREAAQRIRLARGFQLNGRAFPKCPLARDASQWGEPRCAQRAKVGEGTFEADARPLIDQPVTGTYEIFNGPLREGRTTLVFLAESRRDGDATMRGELNYEHVGSLLRTLPPPEGVEDPPFTVTKTATTLGARHQGTPYVRTPPRCRGAWRSGQVIFFEGGGAIHARDSVSCVPRRR